MTTQPAKLDISMLPTRLRDNWHILSIVRSWAHGAYLAAVGNTEEASRAWLAANPLEDHWPHKDGEWPKSSDKLLGKTATFRAVRLVGLTPAHWDKAA